MTRLFAGLLCLLPRVLPGLLLTLLRRLLPGLLALLSRVLAWLLTLLPRLVALPALLRLALVVLIHAKSPELTKYNLNVHHPNYWTDVWSMLIKTSAVCPYIIT
jgi:hypothetical protein